MSAVTIEEGDEERSIVTPDFRLRFRWLGDRWTYSIDLGPPPWRTIADVVEWSEADETDLIRPTIQEVHLHLEGEQAIGLAVGRAGDHHFSASFRVRYRAYRQRHFEMDSILQDRSESVIGIDIADRCRSSRTAPEVRYRMNAPVVGYLLDDYEVDGDPLAWTKHVCSVLVWETGEKT